MSSYPSQRKGYNPKAHSPAWCLKCAYPADLTASEEENYNKNVIKCFTSMWGPKVHFHRYSERVKKMAIASLK